jgi:hypothetical protein
MSEIRLADPSSQGPVPHWTPSEPPSCSSSGLNSSCKSASCVLLRQPYASSSAATSDRPSTRRMRLRAALKAPYPTNPSLSSAIQTSTLKGVVPYPGQQKSWRLTNCVTLGHQSQRMARTGYRIPVGRMRSVTSLAILTRRLKLETVDQAGLILLAPSDKATHLDFSWRCDICNLMRLLTT